MNNSLVDKLAELDPEKLEEVVDSARRKHGKIKAKEREKERQERFKRPKDVPAKEFNEYVKRTKALFKGMKYSYPVRLELDLTVERLIAWTEDCKPSIVEHGVVVNGNLPKDLRRELAHLFTEFWGSELFEEFDKTNTFETMHKEITQLCADIDRREKELGLPVQTLWEAVYEKCHKYSH